MQVVLIIYPKLNCPPPPPGFAYVVQIQFEIHAGFTVLYSEAKKVSKLVSGCATKKNLFQDKIWASGHYIPAPQMNGSNVDLDTHWLQF